MAGFNNFSQVAQRIKPACQEIVSETVKELAEMVQENAPYDTGYLHDSVYCVTPTGESTYGQASSDRQGDYLLPEVSPESDTQGVVGVGAYYAQFIEMGHHVHNSATYVPPNPFFYPAMEEGTAVLEEHASEFEGLL